GHQYVGPDGGGGLLPGAAPRAEPGPKTLGGKPIVARPQSGILPGDQQGPGHLPVWGTIGPTGPLAFLWGEQQAESLQDPDPDHGAGKPGHGLVREPGIPGP